MYHNILRSFALSAVLLLSPVLFASQAISFSGPKLVNVGSTPAYVYVLAAGDVNGDGSTDLIADLAPLHYSQYTVVLLGDGKGGFTQGPTLPYVSSQSAKSQGSTQLIDVNGDGKLDIISVVAGDIDDQSCDETGGQVTVLLGDGHGNFTQSYQYTLPPDHYLFLAAGDFNKDGKKHLAVYAVTHNSDCVGPAGDLYVFTNQGKGRFLPQHFPLQQPAGSSNTGGGTEAGSYLAAGDFNGDGKLDLAYVPLADDGTFPATNIFTLSGKGDGSFSTGPSYKLDSYPGSILAADLNHDGKADLVVALSAKSGGQPRMATLLAKTGGFYWSSAVSFPSAYYGVTGLADFNGDGIPDLYLSNSINESFLTWTGTGGGHFGHLQTFSTPYALNTVVAPLKRGGLPSLIYTYQPGSIPNHSYVGLRINTTP